MRLKLFKKYFLTTSAIIVFSLGIMMVILSFVLNSNIAKSKQTTLKLICEETSEYLDAAIKGNGEINEDVFEDVLNSVASVADSDAFIVDKNGNVIVCGCEEWKENSSCRHAAVSVSDEDLSRYSAEDKLYLSTLGIYEKPHYICAQSVKDSNGDICATVFSAAPVSAVSNMLSAVAKLYFASALLPLILMFFSIYAMTYKLTKPLKMMSEASRAMAKGDFSKRIPVMSDDEIGELSVSFNMMTNSLSQLEGMRKSFVANVSHELKTPMTTIGGFIDGILDGTIEPEKQRYYLEIVSTEIKRLSRLVQSMLSMSKLESGEFALKPELFNFSELLFSVVISQEQRIEKQNLEIIGLDTMESISVKADKDLIHQVIYNLVDNAVKFTDTGGKIKFSLEKEGKNLIFSITNTGKGIPEKDLPYIFERFYKVDKSRSAAKNSTGLGLYIVKTIITAHSGKISVMSKENEFTTFKIILPTI